ncbi:hypothetical protein S83_034166, partial [Arachis hypogaea]
ARTADSDECVYCSVTNRILHHTIGLPDFTQGLCCFQTVTCYQAVVNNLEDAHEMLDTAISTTLKESKPVYISISCNLAAIPYPTFSREPVPFSLSPKLSNQMGLEAAYYVSKFFYCQVSKGMKFVGGETAALSRVYEYFWKKLKSQENYSYMVVISTSSSPSYTRVQISISFGGFMKS